MSKISKKYWVMYNLETGPEIDPRIKLFDPEIFYENLQFDKTINEPTENSWLKVSVKDFKITEILEKRDMAEFVSMDELNLLNKENINNMTNEQNQKINSKFKKPENLFITPMNWNLLNSTIDLGKYPLLIGPKVCGKTQTAYELAKARGMNFYPINCGAIFKPKQTLVGQMQASNGTTYLLESEFLKYFTSECEEGVLIFLDEISRIPPAAANYFMTILDRIQSYIYIEEEGKRVNKGKNVIFIAAANFGYEYSDTRNIDGALIDRFIKFNIDYLPANEEVELITKRIPDAKQKDIERLVNYATMLRENSEKLRVSVSTRQLIDMSEYLPLGYDVKTIFDNIFVNLFINGSMDERDTVNKMIDSVI